MTICHVRLMWTVSPEQLFISKLVVSLPQCAISRYKFSRGIEISSPSHHSSCRNSITAHWLSFPFFPALLCRFLRSSSVSCCELNFVCFISTTLRKHQIFPHWCRPINRSRKESISFSTERTMLSDPSVKRFGRLRLSLSLCSDKCSYFNLFFMSLSFNLRIFILIFEFSQFCLLILFWLSIHILNFVRY
jgi:hypothetical protein